MIFPVVWRGKTYTSLNALSADAPNFISPGGIKQRVDYTGMSLEDALTLPVKKKRSYVYDGVEYSSLGELSRATGVGTWILSKRLRLGWKIEDAVRIPLYYKDVCERDDRLDEVMQFVSRYILEGNRVSQLAKKVNENVYLYRRHILDWWFRFHDGVMDVQAVYRLTKIKSWPIYRVRKGRKGYILIHENGEKG